jgi:hypothetical protein
MKYYPIFIKSNLIELFRNQETNQRVIALKCLEVRYISFQSLALSSPCPLPFLPFFIFKTYQTWKVFIMDTLGDIKKKNILVYLAQRLKLFRVYSKDDMESACMDFTTALALSSYPSDERKHWIELARKQIVTLHDISYVSSQHIATKLIDFLDQR